MFKATLKGVGIVNYDGKEQKDLIKYKTNISHLKDNHKNVSYAKKHITSIGSSKDANGNSTQGTYKIAISSNALKHELYKNEIPFQSPNILHTKYLLLNAIASESMIMRGYLFTGSGAFSVKRSGVVTMTDAIQTNDALSTLETLVKSGSNVTIEDEKANTFFKKENIGEITYETRGAIELKQLQFISTDEVHDRMALSSDWFDEYKKIISKRINFDSEINPYMIKGSVFHIPERGFLLSDETVVDMSKNCLRKLMGLRIQRNNAYAEVVKLSYKFVYDPIEDRLGDEDGWVELTKESLNELTFEPNNFYDLVDLVEYNRINDEIDASINIKINEKKKVKPNKKNTSVDVNDVDTN